MESHIAIDDPLECMSGDDGDHVYLGS